MDHHARPARDHLRQQRPVAPHRRHQVQVDLDTPMLIRQGGEATVRALEPPRKCASTSTPPRCSIAASARAGAPSGRVRSATKRSASAGSAGACRAAVMTCAPASRKRYTVARPAPLDSGAVSCGCITRSPARRLRRPGVKQRVKWIGLPGELPAVGPSTMTRPSWSCHDSGVKTAWLAMVGLDPGLDLVAAHLAAAIVADDSVGGEGR